MEKNRHNVRPVHHTIVQAESLNFRRRREICLGSGNENTSMGRVVPSLGRRDSVRDKDIGGGGGSGDGRM
jgi:hypothetical protein